MGSSWLISIILKIYCLMLGKTLTYILRAALTFGIIQLLAEAQAAQVAKDDKLGTARMRAAAAMQSRQLRYRVPGELVGA